MTWANHFLFSHSCSEVQCLYSDHRRSKMPTLWGNALRKSEPEKFSQNIFQFNFFLTTEDCCHHVFCRPMASIEYLRGPRGSQSSNHRTVWNARDVLITVFLFQKYKQLHLNTSASLEIRLMPFQLSCACLENRSEAERGARKKKNHTCGPIFSPHLHHSTQTSAVFFRAICTSSRANIRYSHSAASILNVFSAAYRTLFCLDQRSRSGYATRYLWVKSNVATLHLFWLCDAEGQLGLRCEVCHHAIKAQKEALTTPACDLWLGLLFSCVCICVRVRVMSPTLVN